jgi:Gas vesicle protein
MMAKRQTNQVDEVLDPRQETVLDALDHLLTKGVLLNGDVTLGVAGVDLVYLRLSALLCAADRVFPPGAGDQRRRRRRRTKPSLVRRRR